MSKFFLLMLIFLAVSTHAQLSSRTHLKSCYLLFGGLSDLGYTFAHNKGRLGAHQRFSLDYPNITLDSEYALGAFFGDTKAIVQDFVDRGCEVILATSAAFTGTIMPFVERYPNITFSLHNGWGTLQSGTAQSSVYCVARFETLGESLSSRSPDQACPSVYRRYIGFVGMWAHQLCRLAYTAGTASCRLVLRTGTPSMRGQLCRLAYKM